MILALYVESFILVCACALLLIARNGLADSWRDIRFMRQDAASAARDLCWRPGGLSASDDLEVR